MTKTKLIFGTRHHALSFGVGTIFWAAHRQIYFSTSKFIVMFRLPSPCSKYSCKMSPEYCKVFRYLRIGSKVRFNFEIDVRTILLQSRKTIGVKNGNFSTIYCEKFGRHESWSLNRITESTRLSQTHSIIFYFPHYDVRIACLGEKNQIFKSFQHGVDEEEECTAIIQSSTK